MCTFSIVRAQVAPMDDPVGDFVKRLIGDRGVDISVSDSPGSPPGGYIFRFELPAGFSDTKLMFLAWSADCDKEQNTWVVYQQEPEKPWHRVCELLVLPLAALSATNVDGRAIYSAVHFDPREGGSLLSFAARPGEKLEIRERPLTKEEITVASSGPLIPTPDVNYWAKDKSDRKAIAGLFDVKVDKLLLADYHKDPTVSWRSVDRRFNLYQQQSDPADQNDIRRLLSAAQAKQEP